MATVLRLKKPRPTWERITQQLVDDGVRNPLYHKAVIMWLNDDISYELYCLVRKRTLGKGENDA